MRDKCIINHSEIAKLLPELQLNKNRVNIESMSLHGYVSAITNTRNT